MGGGKSGNNAPSDADITAMSGPWKPLQNNFKTLNEDFTSWYNDPASRPTYGPNVIQAFNPAQSQALQQGIARASGGFVPGLNQATSSINRTIGAGTGGMPGFNFFNRLGAGAYGDPAMGTFKDINRYGYDGSAEGIDTLRRFASGAERGGNPYLDAMHRRGVDAIGREYAESIMPGINSQMSMTGTGGGGSMEALLRAKTAGEMGDNIGNFSTDFLGSMYNADTDRMMQAAGALPGAEATLTNSRLAGAQALSGANQQQLANRMAGYGAANDQYQQNFMNSMNAGNQLAANYQAGFMPMENLFNFGQQQQTQDERMAAEASSRHQFEQNAPFNFMNQYLQGLSGINANANPAVGAQYAMQEMQQQPNQMWGNILGLVGAGSTAAGAYYGRPGNAAGATQQQNPGGNNRF